MPVIVYNRTRERAATIAGEIGAEVATSPAAAARAARIVITMLADEDAVRAVYEGPDGLIAGLAADDIVLDMTTVSPSSSRRRAAMAAEKGAHLLDAPVSGSVPAATDGVLTIMVGGDVDIVARARPVLEVLGAKVFHMGAVGAGATIKLVVNSIVFALNEAVAESLVLAERAGVEREAAYEVLANSAIAAPLVAYKRESFLHPEEAPTAFSVELAGKDLRLVLELAAAVGAALPQTEVNFERLKLAAERYPGRDFSFVAQHLRDVADETSRDEATE